MSISIKQKIGQLIIAGFRGKTISECSDIENYILNYNIGGIILYDEDLEIGGNGTRNIESPNQLKTLVDKLQDIGKQSLLISIDQEGGKVDRLKSIYGFKDTPSWQHIGHLNNTLITNQYSQTVASTLSEVGINLNFAPVLDLSIGPGKVMHDSQRAFSPDPKKVVEHAKIFINAHKSCGIISCGKHFPGLGSGSLDTHDEKTDLSETWTVKDLLPFDQLIQDGALDMIMVSHAFYRKLDPDYPSSLSKLIINNVLRDDLGFGGLIICDDPSMRAISEHYDFSKTFELMLNAGIDLFCLGNNLIYDQDYIPRAIETIYKLVKSKKISEERILESVERINNIKTIYNIDER